MDKLHIEVNLSIDKSGGASSLPKVIEEVRKALEEKYNDADIIVRKGYFQTIDGISCSDLYVEGEVRSLVNIIRERVLSR